MSGCRSTNVYNWLEVGNKIALYAVRVKFRKWADAHAHELRSAIEMRAIS